jgi:hypothetical protein
MEIRSKNGNSVGTQIIGLLTRTLPSVSQTQKSIHLHKCRVNRVSKGKIVDFIWMKREFRITANLKVMEYAYGFNCHILHDTEMSRELEQKVREQYIKEN